MSAPISPSPNDVSAPRDIDTIVTVLTTLQNELIDLSRGTSDTTTLLQLHTEYLALQTLLSQAAHAQLATDDGVFAQATTTLKSQSKLLDGMEDQIKSLVKDVDLAAKIAGGVTQVITLIAKL